MAQQWYYEKDGIQHGPVTSQQLKQLAVSGELQPSDSVCRDGRDERKPAKAVKGLFAEESAPMATPPPKLNAMAQVKWSACGPKLTAKRISKADADLKIALPVPYRRFLLKQNGGVPKPAYLDCGGDIPARIGWFYSIGTTRDSRELVSITQHFRHELDLPARFLPIALIDELHDVLLMRIGRGAGKIVLWSMIESGFDTARVAPLWDSLPELLSSLAPFSVLQAALRESKTRDDSEDWHQVYDAICIGKTSELERALQHLSDLSSPPPELRETFRVLGTPVIYAITECNLEALQVLHAAGHDQGVRNADGQSPSELLTEILHGAQSQGNAKLRKQYRFAQRALKLLRRRR